MKTIILPGSKSITNRDLILAALAEGNSILRGFLTSDDTVHMINALRQLGVDIKEENGTLFIDGGVNKIKGNGSELFLGNSGTSTRFLSALSALNKFGDITITGDERMKQRPIKDLVDGIIQLGVKVETTNGFFPITIKGGNYISANTIQMKGDSSSQYFTAMLQIAPFLEKGLTIEVIGDLVSKPYIDITINEMNKFGVQVENDNYKKFRVVNQSYKPVEIDIEGDASALSYIVCYNVLQGGEIKVDNIGKSSRQGDYKFLEIMKMFGLEYTSEGNSTILISPGLKNVDLTPFKDFEINFNDMPDVSMSFMFMSIFLPGNTKIMGLETLNLKECKRIDSMRDELRKLGVKVESDNSSIIIGEYNGFHNPADIETYNDHRMAMCFGTLNTFIGGLNILNPGCVSKTYPNFWKDLDYISN